MVMVVLGLGISSAAQANMPLQHWGKFIWGPPNTDPVRPHLETAKVPNNAQWDDDPWTPQDWIETRGSAAAVIDGFYAAGIITDQYLDDDIPVLEVGQNFIELSPQEKRRVAAFVDLAYGVTASSARGYMLISFHNDDEPVGIYNRDGLQLQ
jgi:hypothetical protein